MEISQQGQLFIVATPIGNLSDISQRAIDTLRQVDTILCEDTRVSKQLMSAYGISTLLESLHEHNERMKCQKIIESLSAGKNYALISDAGLPVISDPGQYLVASVLAADLRVVAIPGPCAVVSALACSGLDASNFIFEGFLPATASERRKKLSMLKEESRTMVFYEAPHRLQAMLADLSEIFGNDRHACLAKELTKIHETIVNGSLAEITQWLNDDPQRQKGEFVIILAGNPAEKVMNQQLTEQWLRALLKHLPPRTAAGIVAEISGMSKNDVYKMALRVHDKH